MAKIEFKNVKVTYLYKKKEIDALNDFSAIFSDKKINVIIGYSGSGKSTILRALTEQVHFGGDILFNDKKIEDLTSEEKNLSIVQQNFSLYPQMTIFDNIAFPLKIQNYSYDEINRLVKEIAKAIGLDFCLARMPKELSWGQQQRVALARALVKKPDVVLFDEPLSNLDESSKGVVLDYIKKLTKEYEVTSFYITHDIKEAVTIGEEFFVIDKGQLIMHGNKGEFLNSKNEVVKTLLKGSKF